MHHYITADRLFDGFTFRHDQVLELEGGKIIALHPRAAATAPITAYSGTLAPGFLDLQVNGGGGVLLDGQTDAAGLAQICAAHRSLGVAGCLPTLITETAEATAHVLALGIQAGQAQLPGFLGLHLEGPHLDPRRKGAHDIAKIRPMESDDLNRICDAARQLPHLTVTLAPEAVTYEQIAALTAAGVLVSLGHSDCSYDSALAAIAAGARNVTHLFNAMSQLGHRSPGLVGAALTSKVSFGLIADGIHCHNAAMITALSARQEGGFLVTDCMSFAGTDLTEMILHGRRVLRHDGRLTLEDGTLAGADLTMDQAVAYLITQLCIAPERALAMATRVPAEVLGISAHYGTLRPGSRADLVLLNSDYRLQKLLFS